MDPKYLRALRGQQPVPLLPSASAVFGETVPALADVASKLEAELRRLIGERRTRVEMSTLWDDGLSYALAPALSACVPPAAATTGVF